MEKYTILLVDDDERIRGMYARIVRKKFSGKDLDFLLAKNGEDALSQLNGDDPAVVLTDHDMPIMNGSQLLEAIAARYPSTTRILTSAMDQSAVPYAHRFVDKVDIGSAGTFEQVIRQGLAEYRERIRQPGND